MRQHQNETTPKHKGPRKKTSGEKKATLERDQETTSKQEPLPNQRSSRSIRSPKPASLTRRPKVRVTLFAVAARIQHCSTNCTKAMLQNNSHEDNAPKQITQRRFSKIKSHEGDAKKQNHMKAMPRNEIA
jgi:hypothetical protein